MTYMILDNTGNAINAFDDVVAARAALRSLVEAEPETADGAFLIAYDDDGNPVGEAQMFADLPIASYTVHAAAWLTDGRTEPAVNLGVTTYVPGRTPRLVVGTPVAA